MALVTNATKTLADMRTAVEFLVREEIGDDAGDLFTTAEANSAINAGLHTVYDVVHKDPDIIWTSTVALQREYNIPEAKLVNGRAVVDRVFIEESDGTMTEIFGQPWDYDDDDTDPDVPTGYYVTGTYLGLEPTPDDVYTLTIHYRRDFTPLSDDTDETELGDIEIDAALYYAAHLLKAIDEEYEAANFMKSQFEEILGRASTLQAGVYKDGSSYGPYGGAE